MLRSSVSKPQNDLFTTKEYKTDRLKAMEKTNDGFELAEIDLELRGPGEVYGVRQS